MRLRALAAGGCALAVLATPATATAATAHTLSASEAKKLAKAGVLTTKDLKGWEFEPVEVGATDDKDEAAMYKCLGLSKPSFTARNRGYDIGSADRPRFIESSADVVSSISAAKAYFTALQSKKGAGCVKKLIVGALSDQGAPVVAVSVKAVSITVSGADMGVAFHIVEASKGFVLDGYLIQALVGRTEITVSPVQIGGGTPGLSQGRSLTRTVVKRVRAL
jgi:hypothetical protein